MSKLLVRDFLSQDSACSETVDYRQAWQRMREFTDSRSPETADELWLLEHPPVFTLGQAADPSHLLDAGNIPVIQIDRGGQVTYHGPGQIMLYLLYDLKRAQTGVRQLVEILERSVIDTLEYYGIKAEPDRAAPGVYIGGEKIAALGLRVRRGCSYHGLCFNFAFDDEPFQRINPCGYEGLQVTQLQSLLSDLPDRRLFAHQLAEQLAAQLEYNGMSVLPQRWRE